MSALALGAPWEQESLLPPDDGTWGIGGVRPGSGCPVSGGPDGAPSLDTLVCRLWEGLAVRQAVACPMCDGELEPVYGLHARPIGGRCRRCGTELR